jgi:hypothetical protein
MRLFKVKYCDTTTYKVLTNTPFFILSILLQYHVYRARVAVEVRRVSVVVIKKSRLIRSLNKDKG